MIYLLAGVVVLVVFLVAGRAFVAADPATVKRFLMWFGGILGVLLVLVAIDSGLGFLVVLAGLGVGWFIFRQRFMPAAPSSSRSKISEVETEYLRMSLEHDTGIMTGTVRKGRFRGRRLEELDLGALIALWREVRAEDAPSVGLMESYLDRFMPDWREKAEATADPGGGPSHAAGSVMTREEAYAVLGLKPGASPAEIKDAHRHLMMKIHPDHGGSDVLAAQVNRAKDVLLGN